MTESSEGCLIPPLPCATGCHNTVTTLLTKPRSFSFNCQHQTGAVLAISLIILLLLTIIGITASQVTGLEEKMAGNLRDRNLAFQAAETALREGEKKTSSLPQCPILSASGGFYPHTDSPVIDDSSTSVWSNPGKYFGYEGESLVNITSTRQPKFIIQCINSVKGSSSLYRITARGTGGTTDAVVILQSIYKR
jgi:type IV pilus assembly protein PilX